MSPEEYSDFCDAIADVKLTLAVNVNLLRQEKHIGLMYRGSKTASLFDRVGVDTPYMTVIVRGEGLNVANRVANRQRN